MIIDFSVKNYRSFREEQTLSFVANTRDESHPGTLIDPGLPGVEFSKLRLLKTVAIYGANAAGKTNILMALRYLSFMVGESATSLDEGDETQVQPFALDPHTPEEPSEFVLRFVVEGVRYHFVLVVNPKRVLFESLSAFPKGREQVWYEREWNDDRQEYKWGPSRPTGYKRDSNLMGYTRSNALYLSTAVKFNDEQLKPVYLWFKNRIRLLRVNDPLFSPEFTARQLMENPNKRAGITRLLQHADMGLLSASASKKSLSREELPEDMPDELVSMLLDESGLEIELGHSGTAGKEYPMGWDEESAGTKKFFALSGPWLDTLEQGYFVGLDEIESSMHPLMVHALMKLFLGDRSNLNSAQLVFTTHNPLLLDLTLLRRDMIWFADKDQAGGTSLYPLTDYKPRKKESLVRGYLSGRYGAVPFIPESLYDSEKRELMKSGAIDA